MDYHHLKKILSCATFSCLQKFKSKRAGGTLGFWWRGVGGETGLRVGGAQRGDVGKGVAVT